MGKIFNTGETQEQLREKYNPEGSVLRNAQLRMLSMLTYLDEVCTEIGVPYALDSGTLLGAYRHGGFIPWDDDVDVVVPMKDYNRLCTYLREHPHPQFVLQTPETDPLFWNYWNVLRDLKSEYIQDSKIHNLRKYRGMQVDIFPVEEAVLPVFQVILAYLHSFNLRFFLGHINWLGRFSFKVGVRVLIPFFRFLSKCFGKKSVYAYAYGLPWYHFRFPETAFFPLGKINFEGHEFCAPADIKAYLSANYADYESLPSVDNRDCHQATYRIWE